MHFGRKAAQCGMTAAHRGLKSVLCGVRAAYRIQIDKKPVFWHNAHVMTIYLIRHGLVDFDWEKKLTSKEYDKAWSDYDYRPIKPITKRFEVPEDAKIFVTSYQRTQETARQYLGREDFTIVPDGMADEVPLVSYKDSEKARRVWKMNVRGRIQWYTHGKRQPEWRRNSLERANKLLDYLEAQDAETVVVVFHGFFLRTVSRALRLRGYKQEGRPKFSVPNLLTVKAVKP